jgi:hypothetical protein
MDKFLYGFIKIEKFTQIVALVGVIMFLGYLGFSNYRSNSTHSLPITSPTTQQ